MKIALFSNMVSPHQMPLAYCLRAKLGEAFKYIYTDVVDPTYLKRVGCDVKSESWCVQQNLKGDEYSDFSIVSGIRDIALFEVRCRLHRPTYYMSERWFKPRMGFARLLCPSFLRLAWRVVRCYRRSSTFYYLPMGIHAARDWMRMVGLFSGDVRCLWAAPQVAFESRPGGAIVPLAQAIRAGVLSADEIAVGRQRGFVQIPAAQWGKVTPPTAWQRLLLWGYFVAPGQPLKRPVLPQTPLRVLWVGRMLDWKRVDTLIQAVKALETEGFPIALTIVGQGPEEAVLQAKVERSRNTNIRFYPVVPMSQIRAFMQTHSIYVLPSNGFEGWGAVVSEALEEGMTVLGTYEAGSSATLLPHDRLFAAGDVSGLKTLLRAVRQPGQIGPWSAQSAAMALLEKMR